MFITQIKTDKFICLKPSLTVITFDEIFKSVSIHVINLIYSIYGGLNLIKTLNSDIKKIFKHSLLDQMYQRFVQESDMNSIFYINIDFTTNFSEIWTYIDKDKLGQFIIKTCKEISSRAPLPVYVHPGTVDFLNDCGETCEVINTLEQTLTQFRKSTTSIEKLKKYTKDNGLIQFIDKYHPEDDIKNSMFYNKYLKGAK